MTSHFAHSLQAAGTTEEFTSLCRSRLEGSRVVSYDPAALEPLVAPVAATTPASWVWRLPEGLRHSRASFQEVTREFAFNAALNGGFFQATEDGNVSQWQVGGSGSEPLVSWIEDLRTEGLLPWKAFTSPAQARDALAPRTKGLPLADQRLATCEEFADPARLAALGDFAHRFKSSLCATLADADDLARIFPSGFGDDPFRKKALLAILYLAGYLRAQGLDAVADTPLPADYQLPRIFAWHKVLTLSPGLVSALRMPSLLDADSAAVEDLRAAAVVAAADLASRAGVDPYIVDNALFIGARKDPSFQQEAPPPMRCASYRF